jgi:PAS domain S-box-containing protein
MDNIIKDSLNNIVDVNSDITDLESVVQNLTEVVWSIDLSHEPYQITYHNNPLEKPNMGGEFGTFPRTIEEWQQKIHEEDRDRVLEEFVNSLSTGKGDYAYRFQKNDGGYHYFRNRLSVLYADGRPIRLDGITFDIDTIRRNRMNLELSQQRLKSIVDALPDPVFISEKKSGKIIFANEVLFSVFGMSPSDFLGQKLIQFYQSFSGRKSYINKLQGEGHIQNHELVLMNKKSEEFWVSASTMPLEFNDTECYITILQDITFRKQLERELKQSNDRYQLAVEGTNDVIWEYDFIRKSSYLSPQFWEIMELEPVHNPLDKELMIKYLHPEDYSLFLNIYKEKIKGKSSDFTVESRLLANKGKVIYVLIKGKLLYNKAGEPIRVVGSISNITSLKLAQSKLRESEAKYKLISEHSKDCICLQSVTGDFVFVSPSSKDILGYEPTELLSLRLKEIITEKYLKKVSDAMLQVIKKKEESITIVYEATHKDGYKIWLESTGGAIFSERGDVMYLQTSTRNVTERIQAEEMLKESEERYKLITENSHDVVSLMDLDGNYVFVTPSVKDTLGYEPLDVIGKNTRDFIHPDDRQLVEEGFAAAFENKQKEATAVFRMRHQNGEFRWVELSGGIILDDSGAPIYVRTNKIDVTAKLQTEEKLKLQEEKYKLVSENSGDVIGLHKIDGELVFISPSCKRLLGYGEEELRGTNPLKLIREEHRKVITQTIEQTALNRGKDVKMTYEIQNEEGQWLWVETSLTAILNKKNKVDLLQSSTRDISERIEALQKERQLSKLKSSFISMASHEFRTPLTTIQSSNELISMYLDNTADSTDQKLLKHVGRIRTELERLNSLLKDVFTLGRLDVGKTKLNKDFTSLVNIVKQVIVEAKIPHPNRSVQLTVKGKEVQMSLDSQLVSHAISNLVINALKYSEGKDDPTVTIEFKKKAVVLRIEDEGIGVPKKDQQELFESFSRASNVGDIEGTGLGLVIVKQFIEMHNGNVELNSDAGKGAEFIVTLPIESEVKP